MSGPFFVDSNVLVYRRDSTEEGKQPKAADWIERLWESRAGRISVQVLEEFYWTVTRKLKPGLEPVLAREELRDLSAWRPLPLTAQLVDAAWNIEDRFGFSFWDSLIVAAARQAGCRYLLTEDLQDGQDLDGLVVLDPFGHAPDSVGLTTLSER